MRIIIYAIPVILFAVLITGPFYARDDGDDREDAAGPRENPGDADRNPPALEPETESRLTDQPTPLPAAEPRELALAPQEQPLAAAAEWQVVRQRPRDAGRSRQEPVPDQLAREQEAQREALQQRQAQQLERFLELQRRQYNAFLEQQEQAGAEAGRQPDEPPAQSLRQTDPRGDAVLEQRDPLAADQDFQETYGYDTPPRPDPYPDDGSYQEGSYGEGDRVYQPYRRDTIEIPLPGGRALRFRLW